MSTSMFQDEPFRMLAWLVDTVQEIQIRKQRIPVTPDGDGGGVFKLGEFRDCVRILTESAEVGDVNCVVRQTFLDALEAAAVANGWSEDRTCIDCASPAYYRCTQCGASLCYTCFTVGRGVCAQCGSLSEPGEGGDPVSEPASNPVCRLWGTPLCNYPSADARKSSDTVCRLCRLLPCNYSQEDSEQGSEQRTE